MSGFELIGLLGTAASTVGTIAQGAAENRAAKFEAQQMEAKAKEENAASQREAAQSRTEAQLAMSRQQALAASSGGGAGTDAPTIVRLMQDTAGQGELNAGMQLYGGTQRARGLMDSAKGRRMSGKASLLGSYAAGFGQAAKGISGAFG